MTRGLRCVHTHCRAGGMPLLWTRSRVLLAVAPVVALLPALIVGPVYLAPASAATTRPTLGISLEDVSCPARDTCTAVGLGADDAAAVYATVDGGARWSRETIATGTPFPSSVTCSSSEDCLAQGTGVAAGPDHTVEWSVFLGTTDHGSSWNTNPVKYDPSIDQLTCSRPTACDAVEDFTMVIRSVDGGTSWTRDPGSGLPYIDDLACVRGTTSCFTIGNSGTAVLIDASGDGGTTFYRVARLSDVRPGRGGLDLACGSTQSCMLVSRNVGRTLMTTSDAGRHWVDRALPRAVASVLAATCPSAKVCTLLVSAKTHPDVLLAATTRDGGISWALSTVARDRDVQAVASISCPSTSQCFVVGPATPAGSVEVRTGSGGWVRTSVS